MIYLGYIKKCLFHQELSFVLLQLNNNMIVSPNKPIKQAFIMIIFIIFIYHQLI